MSDEQDIICSAKIIAMVGLSPDASRPSNSVAAYLQENGFRVIPVNPTAAKILGETSYPTLAAVPGKVDVVNIFRRSEEVPAIVEEAIKKGASAVWMQEGVINEAAAKKACDAGLKVVMDKCIRKEHVRMQFKRK